VVPYSKPERSGVDPDIIGMTGIPEHIIEAKSEGSVESFQTSKKNNHSEKETHLLTSSNHPTCTAKQMQSQDVSHIQYKDIISNYDRSNTKFR
jgi:hypothetical protein